jgi:hypothetical protein
MIQVRIRVSDGSYRALYINVNWTCKTFMDEVKNKFNLNDEAKILYKIHNIVSGDAVPYDDSTGLLFFLNLNNDSFNYNNIEFLVEEPPITTPRDHDECSVCLTEPRNVVFFPCRHVVCCLSCSSRVTSCVICRQIIVSRYELFFS